MMKISLNFYLILIFIGFTVIPISGEITTPFTGSFSDYSNDVSTDFGVDPFSLPYNVRGRDYMDILTMNYFVNQTMLNITYTFTDIPLLDNIKYGSSFEGSTGQTTGPDFDINAIDSIASITVEYERGIISSARLYNGKIGEEEINISNITVIIHGNQLSMLIEYPSNFLMEQVFKQENLEINGDVTLVENDRIYYDDIFLNEDASFTFANYIKVYWLVEVISIIIIGVILYFFFKRSNKSKLLN